VYETLLHLRTLVLCTLVPAAKWPAEEVWSPAAAVAAAQDDTSSVVYGCKLAACDVLMANAVDIVSVFEAALRCSAAAVLPAAAALPAAAGGTSGGASGVSPTAEAATASDAVRELEDISGVLVEVCMQKMGYPRNPAPFVMLALAAEQGSQVERQLYSLLATMVKVAQCSIGTLLDVACAQCCCAAADAAQALLSGPTGTPSAECSSGPAAAIEMLPCVVIVGRCCIQWGDQMLADPRILLGEDEDRAGKLEIEVDQAPFTVQQWLTAGSACNQLAAAGYAPHAVLQQLQQHLDARLATSVLQGGSPDTAAAVPESQEPSFDTVAAVVQAQEPSPHIAAPALETQVPSSATAAVVMEAHQPLADTAQL
jgi:hypothetical protein